MKNLEKQWLLAEIKYLEALAEEEEAELAAMEDAAREAESLARSRLHRRRAAELLRQRGSRDLARRLYAEPAPEPEPDEDYDHEHEASPTDVQDAVRTAVREELGIALGTRQRRGRVDPESRRRAAADMMRGRKVGPSLSVAAFRRWRGRDPSEPSDWESAADYRRWLLRRT